MARFKADVLGNRGPASRLGTKSSGIYSHTRGWDLGVRVGGDATDEDRDVFSVGITSGSNGGGKSFPLARIEQTEDGGTLLTVQIPGRDELIVTKLDADGNPQEAPDPASRCPAVEAS